MSENQNFALYEDWWFTPSAVEMEEGKNGHKYRVVRGKFQQADQENANGRTYSRKLWEKQLSKEAIQDKIKTRSMFGELDHPKDGKTMLSRVSHYIRVLDPPDANGGLNGEAVVLRTSKGQDLEALFEAGCRVGASSRGIGKLESDGKTVNEDSFELRTIDFVAEPSTSGAYVKPVTEDKEIIVLGEGTRTMPSDVALSFKERIKGFSEAIDRGGPTDVLMAETLELASKIGEYSDDRARGMKEDVENILERLQNSPKNTEGESEMGAVTEQDLKEEIQDLRESLESNNEVIKENTKLKNAFGRLQETIDRMADQHNDLKGVAKDRGGRVKELEEELEAAKKLIEALKNEAEKHEGEASVDAMEVIDELSDLLREYYDDEDEGEGSPSDRLEAAKKLLAAYSEKKEELEGKLQAAASLIEVLMKKSGMVEDDGEDDGEADGTDDGDGDMEVYIDGLVKGHEKEDILRKELSQCETQEEVDERYQALMALAESSRSNVPLPKDLLEEDDDFNIEDLDEDGDKDNKPENKGMQVLEEIKKRNPELK